MIIGSFLRRLLKKNSRRFFYAEYFYKRLDIVPVAVVQSRLNDGLGRETIIVFRIPYEVRSLSDKLAKFHRYMIPNFRLFFNRPVPQ